MLNLTARKMEVRGIANEQSKKGNVYYILRCESEEGEPFQFFARSADVFPQGLKKGDIVTLELAFNPRYKELVLSKVVKVGA